VNRRVDELEIELLRPNEAAFGSAGAGDFVDIGDDLPDDVFDDEPRPRWRMAVAGLLVTGLLAGGVIAAAPWAGDTTATPPTTTAPEATTTTVATPRTTVPRDPLAGVITEPPGWLIGTGGFWQFAGASSYGESTDDQLSTGAQIDVWATRDATRATGPWLTVQTQPYSSGQLSDGAVRTTFGDRRGLITTRPDGVTHAEVSLGTTGPTLLIDSLGLGLDQVAALAAGVTAPARFDGSDPIRYGELRSRSGVFDLPLRLSRPAGYGPMVLLGVPVASSYYYQSSGSSIGVDMWNVDAATEATLALVLDPIEIPPQLQPLADELAAMGREVAVYTGTDQQANTVVMWREGERLITLTGYGPTATLAEMLVAARSARLADDGEWHDLLVQSQEGISFESNEQEVTLFGTGEFPDDGGHWDATLSNRWLWMNGPNAGWYGSFEPAEVPTVRRLVAPDVTLWIGVDPTGAAVTMRVTAAGEAPIDIPMDAFGSGTAAFHPRLVDVAATVELLDAAGQVLATSPSPAAA
jgi:hypothetical protein